MSKQSKTRIPILALLFFMPILLHATITIGDLRCEMLENPLGIDSRKPRFSWRIFASQERNVQQRSYHILVASTKEQLEKNVEIYGIRAEWIPIGHNGSNMPENH
jgi:alpha-L-rhamnosidase